MFRGMVQRIVVSIVFLISIAPGESGASGNRLVSIDPDGTANFETMTVTAPRPPGRVTFGFPGGGLNGYTHIGDGFNGRRGGRTPGQTENDSKDADETGCPKGNPILISTGNKIEPELDFAGAGEMGLYLQRTYNLSLIHI